MECDAEMKLVVECSPSSERVARRQEREITTTSCNYYGTLQGMPDMMKWIFYTPVVSSDPVDSTDEEEETSDDESIISCSIISDSDDDKDNGNDDKDDGSSEYHSAPPPILGCREEMFQMYDPRIRNWSSHYTMQISTEYLELESSKMTDLSKLSIRYARNGGFLSFKGLVRVLCKYDLSTTLMLSLLGTVPDVNILRNVNRIPLLYHYDFGCDDHFYLLTNILQRILWRWTREVLRRDSSSPLPQLLDGRVGRLWLMVQPYFFYNGILTDLLRLPHLGLYLSESSFLNSINDRLSHCTNTTLVIMLARLSYDLEGEHKFLDFLLKTQILEKTFHLCMTKGYTPLAVIFSLFVDRETFITVQKSLDSKCNTLDNTQNIARTALDFMSIIRDLRCKYQNRETYQTVLSFIDDLFNQDLATRSLGCIIKHHGLLYAFHMIDRYSLPSHVTDAVHRFFYGISWRYIVLFL